jgi:aldehyde dehydrogenase (NAD+)
MLDHKYQHIFFTGSSKVARFITAAAAKHLTPTVLELGGQGPAIVTKSANVDLAAKRIAYAKFLNAGQICLSVNHVFADPAIYDDFVQKLDAWNKKFSGDKGDMCQIVNKRNFDRLTGLLEKTSGEIRSGGKTDNEKLQLAPTVVANIKLDGWFPCPIHKGLQD